MGSETETETETETAANCRRQPKGAPATTTTVSMTGHAQAGQSRYTPVFPERVPQTYGIRATFGIDLGVEEDDQGQPKLDKAGGQILKEREVNGYSDCDPMWVPKIDPDYVFPVEETKAILLGMEARDRILIVGETGTGKTSVLEQIAARLNYNVVKLSFDGGITRHDLVGEWVVKGTEMVFNYGILPLGMRMPGTIIILDEWDTISGDCSFVLQRPLQKEDGKLLMMETGGEIIPLHESNLIAATANTAGQGDDTGLYSHGTKVQNYAQLNRFSNTIRLGYMPEDKEKEMIQKRFPELDDTEVGSLVRAVNIIREGYQKGDLSAPLSTRDLINWAEKYLMMGEPLRAAKYAFLNRMPPEDSETAIGLIQRSFED